MRYHSLVAVAVCVCAAAGFSSQNSGRASGYCQTGDLKFALGASTGAAGQQKTLAVDLANTGPSACTMAGFPAVSLVGSARGEHNYTWPLEWTSQSYQRVTVRPGGTAHFDIVYLPANPHDASWGNTDLLVSKLVITPPHDHTSAVLTWHQSVLLQDGATHPGTYSGPVVPGR
jgi:hypothetical protein